MATTVTEIWREIRDSLRAFVAKRVANEAEVEDILQEVFVRVHRRLDRLNEPERVVAWLYQKTARNAVVDYYRSSERRHELPGDRERMRRSITGWIFLMGLSGVVILEAVSGLAQTPPPAPSIQNQPAPSPPSVAPDLSGAVSSAGPAVTPITGAGSNQSSSFGKSFGSAGRGLPGMPGGPAINGTLGAQDPSGRYMRPPVIPPLLCDPGVDLPC